MITLRELFRRPLPNSAGVNSLILRTLMLPNVFLTRTEGSESLAASESAPCIFAFNHNNVFESLFVPALLMFLLGGRKVSFVIDWMFGHLPLIGWLMRKTDPVFVYSKPSCLWLIERWRPKNLRMDVPGACCQRLDAGSCVGIFPEGRRNGDPVRLFRARPGVGHIALASGAAVIPVGIWFPASERLGRAPLAGRMVVRFGKPMRFDDMVDAYRASKVRGQSLDSYRLAESVAGEVMFAISGLCGKRYDHRLHHYE